MIGLGLRAGRVVIGTGSVRRELQRSGLVLVIVASDASQRTGEKVVRLAQAKRVPIVMGPDASELGAALGRGSVQAVGVKDLDLASGIRRKLIL